MNNHIQTGKVAILLVGLFLSVLGAAMVGVNIRAVSASPSSGTYFDHVVIIMMEDHGINNICARSPPPCLSTNGDPYAAGLANSYGIGSQYLGVSHFSQADYIATLGGDINGCVGYPCQPSSNTNLVDRFEAAGLTWRGYMENQAPASGCDTSYNEPYTPEHNPFVFFTDITSNPARCSNIVKANPTTCSVTDCTLIDDLNSAAAPNFMWLTPNNCNNMHGVTGICATSIPLGDSYLSGLVPNILNSQAFTTQRSALFLVFDEGNGYCPLNGSSEDCVYAVWAGPGTKTGFVTSNLYNHYSFTKTVEINWNLASLASNDAAATPMTEFFTTNPLSTSFAFSPSSPVPGQSVTFTGTASGGTAPYTFSWTFGDGNSVAGNPVTHVYSAGGSYTVTLTTSDSAGHTAAVSNSITVSTSDFKLVAKPYLLTVLRGQNSQSAIAVTSLGGFKGTVALTASVSPQGLTVSMQNPSVTLNVGQTVNDNLKVVASKTVPTGIYIATVTGTSGSLVHALNVTVRVPDFNMTANPATLNISPGSSGSSQILFQSLYTFQGGISTTVSVSSAGPKATLNPNNPSLTVNGTKSSVLTVQVPSNQASGVYNVTIKATSGSLLHLLVVQVHVGQHTSATVVNCSPSSVLVNQASNCTATVTDTSTISPVTPRGTVTFAETGPAGSFSSTTCALVSGNCSVTFTATATGDALITAAYGGDSAHSPSTSQAFSVTVTTVPLHNTTTTVTCASPVLVNQGSSCTATVTDTDPSPTTPTGTVTFTETGPAGAFSSNSCSLSSGSCSVTFTPTTAGNGLVTGTYNGDSSHGGSTSTAASITADPRTTSTSLVCPSPVVVNQASSCTATVSDTSPGTTITPSGSINFTETGAPGSLSSATCTLISGSCSVSFTATATGTAMIVAAYGGDTGHNASTSSGASMTINQRTTSTALACTGPVAVNQTSSCTATITDSSNGGSVTPSGSVSLSSNSTGVFSQPSCSLTASGTVGVASCSVSYTPSMTGFHAITANYAADSSHLASSGSTTVTVAASAPKPAYALVVSADGKVSRLYQNGTLTLVGQPVTTPLRSVAWKPDGSYALISGDFAVLLKFDGATLTTIPTGIATGFNFWTVSWKPDGSYALVGGTSGILFKYDGVTVTTIPNTSSTILSITWNPSGSYALLAGKAGLALTYDGTTVRSFATGTTFDLDAAAWTPNGGYALIGGLNRTLLQFDGTTVVVINTGILSPNAAIRAISFNPTGSLALLAGDSGMVLTWNGSTLTMLPTLTSSWLYSISWSSSGTAYIVGGSGTVLTYVNGTLAKLATSPVTTTQYRGIAWKPQ
jgi:Phosphoesterase family/PKD domain/Bacterial Ig-like domain (group 3)